MRGLLGPAKSSSSPFCPENRAVVVLAAPAFCQAGPTPLGGMPRIRSGRSCTSRGEDLPSNVVASRCGRREEAGGGVEVEVDARRLGKTIRRGKEGWVGSGEWGRRLRGRRGRERMVSVGEVSEGEE